MAYRVTVLDMQPISPPIGGGRLRLLGLYHALGDDLPTTYVGSYDWPGEAYREKRLSDSLLEVCVPLSDEHFAAARRLTRSVGGKTVIDSAFHRHAHLSPDYVDRVRSEASCADVVVFSHPWIYPLVRDLLDRGRQLVVYDSQNVEGLLRTHLLDDGGWGTKIARDVVSLEDELCTSADLVLAASHDDRQLFHRLYGTAYSKIRVVPNGTFVESAAAERLADRRALKRDLGLPAHPVALFLASAYEPNVEAARSIVRQVAPALPAVTFLLCGGVGDSPDIADADLPPNVVVTGLIDEPTRDRYVLAADLAINPMSSGSGTNVKMLDYFAASLAVVTTPVGARGLDHEPEPAMHVCPIEEFPAAISTLLSNRSERRRLERSARRLAEDRYAWERISPAVGNLLKRWRETLGRPRPRFSVVIPTYERHDLLTVAVERLSEQTFRDFEVVIVDQSQEPWPDAERSFGVDVEYVQSDVIGVAAARNRGGELAVGEVLAFTDDDCEPAESWLQNAAALLERPGVVGIEGRIRSTHHDDPRYRTVDNQTVSEIGFMAANLFLQAEVFHAIDGFDLRFDPSFREDTDFGWRALEHGEVPFAPDVDVFHPPHLRQRDHRESEEARSRFFEKDPLLLSKHPNRYRQLYLVERHFEHTPGFWVNFFRGARRYGIEVPDVYLRDFGRVMARRLFNGGSLASALPAEPPPAVVPRSSTDPGPRKAGVEGFDFRDLTRRVNRQLVPAWFRRQFQLDEEQMAHWHEQARRAAEGLEHELPETMRNADHNLLHQKMAHDFWNQVPKDFDSILDVGCSDGFMVRVFQEAGKTASGVNDFLYPTDRLYIEEHDLDVHAMDMHALDFDDGRFDAVWCRHTLEHSFSPLRVLAEIYRVTRRDGYLFVVLPPPPMPPAHYHGHWHQIPDYQLRYMLEMCNFEVIELETVWYSHQRRNDNLEIRAVCRKL